MNENKKDKECPEGKIRNPKTNRCIKIRINKKEIKKKENLFKKLFYPFINRINTNINDRIKYNYLLRKILNINWSSLSYNYNAIDIIKNNFDKFYLYDGLAENINSIDLLKDNIDKLINIHNLSTNPSIFTYDYEKNAKFQFRTQRRDYCSCITPKKDI